MAKQNSKNSTNNGATPDSFVTGQLENEDIMSAIAINSNKDGEIQLSYNTKYQTGNRSITDMLATLIENQSRKDPDFRANFVRSMSEVNGVMGKTVSEVLKRSKPIQTAKESADFISSTIDMIKTEIQPTGLVVLISNTDPEDIQNDPMIEVPVMIHVSGSPTIVAHEMHIANTQFSGKADDKNGQSFDNNENNHLFVNDYKRTLEYLEDGKQEKEDK